MELVAIEPCCAYLRLRNYSPHTIENYSRDRAHSPFPVRLPAQQGVK